LYCVWHAVVDGLTKGCVVIGGSKQSSTKLASSLFNFPYTYKLVLKRGRLGK
jgi:hypothetical protein